MPAGGAAVVLGPVPAIRALADVITGLIPAVSGTILVNGADVGRLAPGRRRIGLVPAGGALLPHRTVAGNIGFGLDGAGLSARARRTEVRELGALLQVHDLLEEHPDRLSPAQRLRVAAVRALAGRPAVILIEDRAGQVPCGPTVAAVRRQNVAVLVLTEVAARAAAVAGSRHLVRPLDEPVSPEDGDGDGDEDGDGDGSEDEDGSEDRDGSEPTGTAARDAAG